MKRELKPEVVKGLQICKRIALILKDQYPNEVMPIKENTLVAFRSKSRLCSNKSLGGSMAHYHRTKPHRVCFMQKFLITGETHTGEYEFGHIKRDTVKKISGTLGFIDLTCHELGHHRTKGHGNKFNEKYMKFKKFMILKLISGEYYTRFLN